MSEPIVETRCGKIQGQVREDLKVFRGIPYAAPPKGARRWLPPEPMEDWTGIRIADTFGAICPQLEEPSSVFMSRGPAPKMDEDCLYLNITSPDLDKEKRPVMVWIHGGAFTTGAGSLPIYNPRKLAKRGNVVVVTLNYRLNLFGFLNLKEITGGRIPATGNEGLLDQIAALQWVKQNIEAFGGDPDNITIFGESAGGMSVGNLLGMLQAAGLFHKAIIQSGGAHGTNSLKRAVLAAENLLDILGIKAFDPERLKNLSSEELLSGLDALTVRMREPNSGVEGLFLQPTVDTDVLTQFPLEKIKGGSARDIPLLIGTNLDEWRFMAAMDPQVTGMDQDSLIRRFEHLRAFTDVEELVETYRVSRAEKGRSIAPGDLFMAIQGDWTFRIPTIRLTEIQNSLGPAAYAYLFTWTSPMMGGKLGACHALDLPFVFGGLEENFSGVGPSAEALVANIQSSWLSFARNGDLTEGSLHPWPAYGDKRETMILGNKCIFEQAPYDQERRAWEKVPDSAWFRP